MVLITGRKPRLLVIVDIPEWAFHTIARALQHHLRDAFDIEIAISTHITHFDDAAYDLIHVLFEKEQHHLPFLTGRTRVLKSVYSHYWEIDEGLSPMDMYMKHLREAHAISVPNRKLLQAFADLPIPVYLCPEGVDTDVFRPSYNRRSGPLIVGWAGNPERAIKRLDWLKQACDGLCELKIASGDMTQQDMLNFYRDIDVIACSSRAEGSPRPLIEGMACGNYPVSFDVGVAANLILHCENGIIVRDESVEGLRAALQQCVDRTEDIRSAARINPQVIRAMRDWRVTVPAQRRVYEELIANA